jgi:hypothetical protein
MHDVISKVLKGIKLMRKSIQRRTGHETEKNGYPEAY